MNTEDDDPEDTLSHMAAATNYESVFSREQCDLMEEYYEGFHAKDIFYDAYSDNEDRLVAIMLNIIANNGTFCPEKFEYKNIDLTTLEV